jgi:hypothetical protein
MRDPDYSSWLTKQQAADAIGVSTKTVEQLAKDRKIERAVWRPDNRGMPRAVYQPDDVARMAQERRGEAPAFVLPVGVPGSGNGNGHHAHADPGEALTVTGGTPAGADAVRVFLEALVSAVISQSSQSSESSQSFENRPVLTLEEAATVSGWSVGFLRRARAQGRLPADRDRWRGADGRWHVGWKIRRKDLEAL